MVKLGVQNRPYIRSICLVPSPNETPVLVPLLDGMVVHDRYTPPAFCELAQMVHQFSFVFAQTNPGHQIRSPSNELLSNADQSQENSILAVARI